MSSRGEQTFLVYENLAGEITSFSYADFDCVTSAVAAGLLARGVGRGHRIQLCLGNGPQFVAIWLAAIRIGAVIVPTDPRATPAELLKLSATVNPKIVVVGRRNAEAVERLCACDPLLFEAIIVDEDHREGVWGDASVSPQLVGDATLPTCDAAAAILFTSGTTSAPKGAIITQGNYSYVGDVMSAAAALRPDDRLLVVLPLFHANAQYYSFCAAISAGASIALTASFSASRFLLQADRLGATCASLFAAPIRMILAKSSLAAQRVALRHVWYAQNLSGAHYAEFARLVGCSPRQLYGTTETVVAVMTNRALDPIPNSMGQQTVGATVALRSPETGKSVACGEIGEVVVAGTPGREIFAGYLGAGDPRVDGWLRTGDFASRDAAGNYWFVGRRSDVLKVSGENVSALEVELVLSDHPNVLEAAVVGEPDPICDEVPVAYVVVGEPTPSVDELDEWCRDRLAQFKRPRKFRFVTDLPRTSVGKIKKFQLGK